MSAAPLPALPRLLLHRTRLSKARLATGRLSLPLAAQCSSPAAQAPRAAHQPAASTSAAAAHACAGRGADVRGVRADAAEASSRRQPALLRARTGSSGRPPCGAQCYSTDASAGASSSHAAEAAAPAPYDVLFCGTDDFAATVLARLIATPSLYSSIAVLVPPAPRPSTRAKRILPTRPVAELAEQHGLTVHVLPPGGVQDFEVPPTSASSLLLTASFGHLLPASMMAQWPERHRLNVHPSLLPLLRGAAPIQWAIARRQQTGVSIQELGERFDTGRLLCQTPVTTDTDADFTSTKAVLADAAAGLLVQTLGDLPRLSAEAQPQSGPSSVAPKLQRKHSLVDWSASVTDVLARQRAFSYLFPLHTVFRGKSVQLHEFTAWPAHLKMPKVMREETTPVGEALITEHGIVVKCGAGHEEETQALLITSLQTEGRKQQSAFGWAVGFALPTDSASRTLGYKPARFGEAVTAKS